MKKPTARTLRKECDRLWRGIVIAKHPSCLLCDEKAEVAHHLLVKSKHGGLRYDLNNGIPMCQRHHLLLHLDPFQPHIRLHAILGPERIGRLLASAKEKRGAWTKKGLAQIRQALVAIAVDMDGSDVQPAVGASEEGSHGR